MLMDYRTTVWPHMSRSQVVRFWSGTAGRVRTRQVWKVGPSEGSEGDLLVHSNVSWTVC